VIADDEVAAVGADLVTDAADLPSRRKHEIEDAVVAGGPSRAQPGKHQNDARPSPAARCGDLDGELHEAEKNDAASPERGVQREEEDCDDAADHWGVFAGVARRGSGVFAGVGFRESGVGAVFGPIAPTPDTPLPTPRSSLMIPTTAIVPKVTNNPARQSGSFQPPKSSAVATIPRVMALASAATNSQTFRAGRAKGIQRTAKKTTIPQTAQSAIPIVG